MQKSSLAKIILYLVIILVFNILYFNIIDNHTPARWVSYAGIHISYLLLCVSSLSYNRFDSSGSVVHVYPKMMVAYSYFMASLICGTILILINNSTITFPIIVHALIIGFYIFHYLLLMNAEIHTEANEQRNRRDAFFIRDCVGRLDNAMQHATSQDIRRTIESFRDAVNGSSMRTIPQVSELEEQIRTQVSQIVNAMGSGELGELEKDAKKGIDLVRERERQIMLYK
ncbi:MAG: hypothetical protein IKX30_07925 [Victivallales bacterium]|nr:hypothetical protein [Victivallales bacterium]